MLRYLALSILLVGLSAKAATIYDTVYINKGQFVTIDTNYFAAYAYNDSANYNPTNSRIHLGIGDSLYLTVFNTDSTLHQFNITETSGYNTNIPAAGNVTIPMQFNQLGMFLMHDDLNYPMWCYMGLGAMIVVDDFSGAKFYWNVKEHEAAWNDSLINGYAVFWTDYYPDYFTLNGKSNPLINNDTIARIEGQVGDTIRIYMANTGQSIHAMHFHGYHLRIVYSSQSSTHTNRTKDTFPVKSMESFILELIPDKPGEYPVHDHNLVAVTGNNIYPNGMFITMLIGP